MKHLRSISLIIIMFAMTSTARAAFVALSFNTSSVSVDRGSMISMNIVGSYSSLDSRLLGGALTLTYDPTIVTVESVVVTVPADVGVSSGRIDNQTGSVSGISFADFTGVQGEFDYATVVFRALQVGTTVLELKDAEDPFFAWVNDNPPFGEPVGFDSVAARMTVIPLPPSAWFLGPTVLGLFSLTKRKKARGRRDEKIFAPSLPSFPGAVGHGVCGASPVSRGA